MVSIRRSRRVRLGLATLAVTGWLAALAAHLAARTSPDEATRERWTNRRNLFLLCSSLSMNSLVAHTAYLVVRAYWGGERNGRETASERDEVESARRRFSR